VRAELFGNGKRVAVIVVVAERPVAARLLGAHERKEHLAGDLVDLARRVR
jgi:hypothetical protein